MERRTAENVKGLTGNSKKKVMFTQQIFSVTYKVLLIYVDVINLQRKTNNTRYQIEY